VLTAHHPKDGAAVSVSVFDDVRGRAAVRYDCDAVVVGSGAGGAPVACELAEAGFDVVVLEEGDFHRTEEFDGRASRALTTLYRDSGISVIYGRPPIVFAEGRCLGGSTVVNGGIAWRPPERVLERWEWEHGIPGARMEAMDPYFARVEQRVAVGPQDPGTEGMHSILLARGAEALGWSVEPIRRNQRHCAGTNNCPWGCPSGGKQSVLVSYIPAAIRAGAEFVCGARVDEIVTDGRRAVGVAGRFAHPASGEAGPAFEVRARCVVLACGAIQTPHLLLRNRLANSSRQVGRNLQCHPNVDVIGIFPEPVRAWQGAHQGCQIHEFLDEGILLASSLVPPSVLSFMLPEWGEDSLRFMEYYPQMSIGGALIEDTTTGRVRRGPGGRPLMTYQIDHVERERLLRGMALLTQVMFAAGADEVHVPVRGVPMLQKESDIRRLYDGTITVEQMALNTVHAMGTCRMGDDARRAVVDPWCESYDVPNLFIADGSVVPTALGVNPQITIMAVATRAARYLLEEARRYLGRRPG
jgi:choline dehydrogenase-like flavoprotein